MFNAQRKLKNPTKLQFTIGFFVVVALLWGVRYLTSDTPQDTVEAPTTLSATHHHRIRGVANYKVEFPDSQSVQIVAAERWGVRPVQNREDAEKRKKELVYVGESPYWHVDRLSSSIPYLVPRAATLLQDIGQAFYDSLYNKGIPFNQLIVTSILRRPVRDDTLKWVLSEVLRDKRNEGRCYIKYEVKQGCFHMTVR